MILTCDTRKDIAASVWEHVVSELQRSLDIGSPFGDDFVTRNTFSRSIYVLVAHDQFCFIRNVSKNKIKCFQCK